MAKSAKHIILQRRALIWLETIATARGIRGCEEVILDNKYVADAAAICGLQMSWEKKFADKDRNWYKTEGAEKSDDYTFVFETKVSRADYQATFSKKDGNRHIPVANFHFIVAAKKVVHESEVPENWGLLVESGIGLSLKKVPPLMIHSIEDLHRFAYKLLRSGHDRKFTYNTLVAHGYGQLV